MPGPNSATIRRKCRLARLDEFPGDQIGVDDGDAKRGELIGHCGLAAGDSTGQADAEGGRSWLQAQPMEGLSCS